MSVVDFILCGEYKRIILCPDVPNVHGETDATYDILRELFSRKVDFQMKYDKKSDGYELTVIR